MKPKRQRIAPPASAQKIKKEAVHWMIEIRAFASFYGLCC